MLPLPKSLLIMDGFFLSFGSYKVFCLQTPPGSFFPLPVLFTQEQLLSTGFLKRFFSSEHSFLWHQSLEPHGRRAGARQSTQRLLCKDPTWSLLKTHPQGPPSWEAACFSSHRNELFSALPFPQAVWGR